MSVGRVAHAAVWESCTGLLDPATISAWLEVDFSPSALKRRLLAGGLVVAGGPDGRLVGFAATEPEDEHVAIRAISTEPESRRQGVARLLLAAVAARFRDRPMCTDILLGNLEAERFCETSGFVPGEVIQRMLCGEQVVERRWWYPLPR